MATLSWPARAPKIIRHRSATCCGVPYEDSHFSSCVCSAGSNWIARLLFGMSEIVAVAVKSVKLFKGHYTSLVLGFYGGVEHAEEASWITKALYTDVQLAMHIYPTVPN